MAKDFVYSENNGEFEITKYTGAGGDVTIPEEIDGKPVTGIGECAFKDCEKITGVTIPNGVKIIGRNAFSLCKNLTSVIIPASVTSIGYHAFFETIWLKNIQESNPFVIVNGILIHANIYEGTVNIPEKVKSIGDSVFFTRPYTEAVNIPDSVTKICTSAFDSSTCEVTYKGTTYTSKDGYKALYKAINGN